MRAAAEMRKEGATRHGGGGATSSVMTIVLPMYAVGIVLYLLYTMTKVRGPMTAAPKHLAETLQQIYGQFLAIL